MGGKDKQKINPIYNPKGTGELERGLMGQLKTIPSQLPKIGYDRLNQMATSGVTPSGQTVFKYQPGKAYNFEGMRGIPTSAYQGVRNQTFEDIQRGQQAAGAQAAAQMSSRGLGKGGLFGAQQQSLAREALEQRAAAGRSISMDQAREQVDLNKWVSQMQAEENMRRAQQSLAATTGLSELRGREIEQLEGLGRGKQQEFLLPYQLMSDLYKTNVGISPGQVTEQKSKMSKIGGAIGGLGQAAASKWCLPVGTLIEMANGDTEFVENIVVGDAVNGGEVLAVQKIERENGHRFYRHTFNTGEVLMSKGHPYFDKLESIKAVFNNNSEHTYDILTTDGYYYVNGVKLGSTMGRSL